MIDISMIELLRVIADSGLLILTWLVQLVIYPSFLYFSKEDFLIWHKPYTSRMTIVVMPLMLLQIGVACWQLYFFRETFDILYFLLVISTWAITFIKAIPLHAALEKDPERATIQELIKVHTWRTMMWSLVFIVGIVYLF